MSIQGTVTLKQLDPLRGTEQIPVAYQYLTSEQLETHLIELTRSHVGDVWAEVMITEGIEELRLRRLARSAG